MKGRFLLDIIVGKGTTILQLFTSEDETLLIGRDTLLILNLSFNIFDRVWSLNFKGDGLTSESLNKSAYLHEDEVPSEG